MKKDSKTVAFTPFFRKALSLYIVICSICLCCIPTFAAEYKMVKCLLGDADMSGDISASDARFTLRLSVGLEALTSEKFVLCDADLDADVTASDARLILRKAVGLESYEAIEVEVPVVVEKTIFDTPAPEAPVINAAHNTFTFVVYGNGHGVGLSQYGAQIMAKNGYTYKEILSHYFENTITVKDTDIPSTTYYAGKTFDTYQLLVQITQQEIGGITEGLPEATKAQAVAVYTLLKQNGFHVSSTGSVGEINWSRTFANCREDIKTAVKAVFGEYVVKKDDKTLTPVMTVYSAMAAGRSVACNDIWWADYPTSVASPFEMALDNFISVYTYSADRVKSAILSYDSSIQLDSNPAKWIQILEQNKSIDENRGYVTKIQVGNKVLSKVEAFDAIINLPSGCFTVTYTP